MRTFIAFKLPEETLNNLVKIQNSLKQTAERGSFTPKENMHLTVRFLGEVSIDKIQKITKIMEKLSVFPAIEMSLQQVSTLRAADVVVAKLKSQPHLFEIEKLLTEETDKLGIAAERRLYTPHITLMRRYRFALPFSEIVKTVTIYNKPFIVDEISLFETQFNDNSPVSYNELYSVKLIK
ncbi:MAG TPA: RNA 2',3'-cyclic phosphodiesterase [Clostridia bacterium]|nr:RNA 2',3'-cyclic phosphodiesterase [Clostridia bacterium]